MALERTIKEYQPGKFRAIWVQVEEDAHPALLRERVEEQLRKRLREEVSIEQLIAALYRFSSVLERAVTQKSEAGDAKIVAHVHELFARVHKLHQRAEAIRTAVMEATPEQLAKIDVASDAVWDGRKAPADKSEVQK